MLRFHNINFTIKRKYKEQKHKIENQGKGQNIRPGCSKHQFISLHRQVGMWGTPVVTPAGNLKTFISSGSENLKSALAAEDHVPSCPYSLQLGLQSKLQDKFQSHTEKPKKQKQKTTTILGFEQKALLWVKNVYYACRSLISRLGWYSALEPAKAQNYSSTHMHFSSGS